MATSPTSPSAFFCLSLLLLLCAAPHPAFSGKCHKDDKKALFDIKHSLGDPYVISGWTNDYACCDWAGVRCDEATSRVTDLDISTDTNLSSTIPPAVGDLPYLQYLTFHKLPNLVGPIVPDIARLSRLKFLRLDWNGLSGPVPSFLATLTNLEYINLSFNRFTGTIPPALSSLRHLTTIDASRNQLTGTIPASFGNLGPDFYLRLSHNSLAGPVPKSLGAVNFSEVDLSRNQLTGDASFLFGRNRVFLGQLDLSRNQLEFDLSGVEFPKSLFWLDLNHNKLFGKIPPSIAKLQLQFLNVSYNQLCGEIPTGDNMNSFDESVYIHNLCLCGAPLPPCAKGEVRYI